MESTHHYPDSLGPYNEQWYRSLFDEVYLSLMHHSYKLVQHKAEAEDIAAHCFETLIQLIVKDPQKFADRNYVKNYLYKMVANASSTYRSSGKRTVVISLDDELLERLDAEALTSELEEHEILEKIVYYVDKLPPKSKEIIRLFFYEGMRAEEIAQKLGQPVESIYKAKQRALNRLRAMALGKEQPITPDTLLLLFWIYLMNP